MKNGAGKLAAGVVLAIGGLVGPGCQTEPPPPPIIAVPANAGPVHQTDAPKPLATAPPPGQELPPPPFDDVPLVDQQPPEEPAFVNAYNRVGRPRIVVFVNRSLQGDVVPVNGNGPIVSVRHSANATGGVSVESSGSSTSSDYYHGTSNSDQQKFTSNGPAHYSESTDIYLAPGQYDEAQARSLDYEAMETILTDWLGGGGQVHLVSPTLARQQLSDAQVSDLQSGRPQALTNAGHALNADVLIQVQAHPTRQTFQGLTIRVIAEAINVRDGTSIGRAVVDVPPPLEKTQINKYTRYLARKLMSDMTTTWMSYAPPPGPPPAPPDSTPPQGAAPASPPAAQPPAPTQTAPPATSGNGG